MIEPIPAIDEPNSAKESDYLLNCSSDRGENTCNLRELQFQNFHQCSGSALPECESFYNFSDYSNQSGNSAFQCAKHLEQRFYRGQNRTCNAQSCYGRRNHADCISDSLQHIRVCSINHTEQVRNHIYNSLDNRTCRIDESIKEPFYQCRYARKFFTQPLAESGYEIFCSLDDKRQYFLVPPRLILLSYFTERTAYLLGMVA